MNEQEGAQPGPDARASVLAARFLCASAILHTEPRLEMQHKPC